MSGQQYAMPAALSANDDCCKCMPRPLHCQQVMIAANAGFLDMLCMSAKGFSEK